ncbi:MAG: hypothetical protein V3U65_19135 [Granulosicoccaceae bacterium]
MRTILSNCAKCALIIPSLLVTAAAHAGSVGIGSNVAADMASVGPIDATEAFRLNPEQLAQIRFSRSDVEDTQSIPQAADHRTEFSFQLKPGRPDFSREGAFGLKMFGRPEMAIHTGKISNEDLQDFIPSLHEGLSYSAGVKIEHEDEDIDGTAYVSSSQLGLSYGRLGRTWYGGVDVNLEQFANPNGEGPNEVLTFDLTTGRRLGFTGLDAASPLWLLSLKGNFDVQQQSAEDENSDWFLNPSLFWQQPGFTFSAQVQLPVELTTDDTEKPDYKLRAVFEKQF